MNTVNTTRSLFNDSPVEAAVENEVTGAADPYADERENTVTEETEVAQTTDVLAEDNVPEVVVDPAPVNTTVTAEVVTEASVAPVANDKSVEELQSEKEAIEAKIKSQQDAQKAAVYAQIKTVMSTYNITLQELVEAFGGLKTKHTRAKAVAKYADPASDKTWSGRGKAPNWIVGKNYADFLI